MITVYSKNNCPFCEKAKYLLTSKGVQFTEIKIDEDLDAKIKMINAGHRTVPQIYKDDQLLVEGGYQGLEKQSDEFFQQLQG